MASRKTDVKTVRIEIVFATVERQELLQIEVPSGSRVGDVVRRSGIGNLFPDYDFEQCTLGIWGDVVHADRSVREGDRIEIYRALGIDPRESRRLLAAQGRSMGAGPEAS